MATIGNYFRQIDSSVAKGFSSIREFNHRLWRFGFACRRIKRHVTQADHSPLIGVFVLFVDWLLDGSWKRRRNINSGNSPSLFIPICMHFFKRHAWHWLRCALSTTHLPVPAWHLKEAEEERMVLFPVEEREKFSDQFFSSWLFPFLLLTTDAAISLFLSHLPPVNGRREE